jgi:hypothetical protein
MVVLYGRLMPNYVPVNEFCCKRKKKKKGHEFVRLNGGRIHTSKQRNIGRVSCSTRTISLNGRADVSVNLKRTGKGVLASKFIT